MGAGPSSPPENFESTSKNDWNPFGIPSIDLNDVKVFNMAVAISGTPPLHVYTRRTFAALSIEKMAAYADGVVRGSYNQFLVQYKKLEPEDLLSFEYDAIGALAYVYLKTGNESAKAALDFWFAKCSEDDSVWNQ